MPPGIRHFGADGGTPMGGPAERESEQTRQNRILVESGRDKKNTVLEEGQYIANDERSKCIDSSLII
jgi:hypothetical protein